jgi:hypothetical protein
MTYSLCEDVTSWPHAAGIFTILNLASPSRRCGTSAACGLLRIEVAHKRNRIGVSHSPRMDSSTGNQPMCVTLSSPSRCILKVIISGHLRPQHCATMFGLTTLATLLLAASSVRAHATFQDLWVNGVDQAGKCVRPPASNSPITSVSTNVGRQLCGAARGLISFLGSHLQRERQHPGRRQLRCKCR